MRYRLFQSAVVAMIAIAAAAQSAYGQCADGSPPPCRTQTVASATRRPDAPIDPRTWIVVPFDNLNNNPDIDWLRTGSVNLLYLGMSRWTDIRVIDDERVADYMREVPGASAAKSLSLAAAIAVAKRAGAAQLVMGDLLKLGNKTTINAKVFDVKTGQRLRSVREETIVADSLIAVFGKMAPRVLNIPAPAGVSAGAGVTSSIAAYREYAEGMAALNLFDLERGRTHLTRALELDSTFALAHAKLAVLLGWVAPNDPTARVHAEAAGRLSGSLPPREQALIKASVAFSHGDYVASCEGFRALVLRDSTDTDAWYGLGDCFYHDNAIVPTDGDSSKPRFRGDRNASLRAFVNVLALDPTYHLAYQHIVETYNLQTLGNNNNWCVAGKCSTVLAIIRPSGDSAVLSPLVMPRDTALYRQQMDEYVRTGARRTMLMRGRAIAEQWVGANPAEGRARVMSATILASLGDVGAADTMLRRAVLKDTGQSGVAAQLLTLELHLKSWRARPAAAAYDTLRSHPVVIGRTPAGPITSGNVVTLVSPMFGRISQYDSLISVGTRQTGAPPSRERFSKLLIRSAMGLTEDSLPEALGIVYREIAPAMGTAAATRALAPLLAVAMLAPTADWPQFDTTVTDARAIAVFAAGKRDTAALRRAALRLDSLSTSYIRLLVPDTGIALVAAGAFLSLGDSSRALGLTRRWLDSVLTYTPLLGGATSGTFASALATRAAIMRADLAAALGSRDEARLWYDRVLGMWTNAEPELQPIITRLRKSRAALGP